MQLTKSLFVAGVQCHKLLWWKVHEPLAKELQPDKVLLDRFDQGRQVGELARAKFPGGVLIDRWKPLEARVAATVAAMEGGAPSIYEGTFVADGVEVAVDILVRDAERGTRNAKTDRDAERGTRDATRTDESARVPRTASRVPGSWQLIEAKMTSSQKDEHIPDAAVQAYVLGKCGVDVSAVAIMHLNPDFRLPAESREPRTENGLLVATDVTEPVRAMLPGIPAMISDQRSAISGTLPTVPIGRHCDEPHECPFVKRCWPQEPDHIGKLYYFGIKTAAAAMAKGINTVWDLKPTDKIRKPAARQIRALREKRMIVEPTLGEALRDFDVPRLGFLDFETVVRAVPPWPGMKPHEQGPAQFSYHEADGKGGYTHVEYLAEGPSDPRRELARLMLDATRNATRVVTYFMTFERGRIRGLQESVPEFRDELKALDEKLIDLLPVVQDHVYHPDFNGSFSIKHVLNPLVPDLSYSDLIIVDGLTASVEIARLLFVSGRIAPEERARVRRDLLAYCERDTFAMVRLLARLRSLWQAG